MLLYLTPLLLFILLPVLAEGAARLYIRRSRYYPWPPGYHLDMTLDPRVHIGGQTLVRLRANERGERGCPVASPAGTFRVLAVGGSAVECYLLDEASTWPAMLEKELRRAAPRTQQVYVGNAGKSSVDSYVLTRMLRKLAPNYVPAVDVLLIMVGASDILRWLEAGAPAEWEGDTSTALEAFLEVNPETVFGWRPRTLALAELWRRRRATQPQSRGNVGKSLLKARQFRQKATRVLEETADSGQMFRRFERYLAESIGLGRQFAQRVIVISQPCFTRSEYTPEELAGFWNGSIGDPYQREPDAFYSPQLIARLMRQLRDRAAAVAATEKVEFVDLCSGAIPDSVEQYYDQFHFTPEGAARVGALLAQVVSEGAGEQGPLSAKIKR